MHARARARATAMCVRACLRRQAAQTVGLEKSASLLGDEFVWGARERCDPTDAACTGGGRVDTAAAARTLAPPPATGRRITDRAELELSVRLYMERWI